MKEQSIFTNLNFMNKKMIENLVKNGDTVVDATLGNGHDALFLGKLIGPEGKLLGFDIQNVAVKKSSKRMKDEGISNYSFINESHDKIDQYIDEASAIVFNLGYLPGASREITTRGTTTLEAIKKSVKILKKPGLISIMFYTGHPGGTEEMDMVLSYVKELDKKEFDVLEFKHINGIKTAPFLLIIYKKGE
ncbi:MAG: class I SAM-dependent methyltransferase [Eubacteriales bacterium]|nr:class I SAM-dependent methyltransferase [Eubacteriales bacterium]